MKKILTILLVIILLTSCENKEEKTNKMISNTNQISFYSEDDKVNYLTFTFDEEDNLESVYMTYVFEDEQSAQESASLFENTEEIMFDSIAVEENEVVVKYLSSAYSQFEKVYKENLILELEKDNYIRK